MGQQKVLSRMRKDRERLRLSIDTNFTTDDRLLESVVHANKFELTSDSEVQILHEIRYEPYLLHQERTHASLDCTNRRHYNTRVPRYHCLILCTNLDLSWERGYAFPCIWGHTISRSGDRIEEEAKWQRKDKESRIRENKIRGQKEEEEKERERIKKCVQSFLPE